MLDIQRISKAFNPGTVNEKKAITDLSLHLNKGEFVTVIGSNGAGKSTLMRTISGLVKAQSGSILWNGQELLGKPIDQIVASGIAMSPEGRRVFADLTVLENLKIGAYLRKDKAETEKDLEWVYSLFPRLRERSWQSAGTLSGGEQQMLAVGRALMAKPKLIMMDEPSLGLAPIVVRGILRSSARSTARASRYFSSSRTRTWRSKSRTGPTSCRPAPSSCRAPAKSWPPTRRSRPRISARQNKRSDSPGSRRGIFARLRCVRFLHIFSCLPIARSGCFVLNWIKFSGESKYGSVNHESGTEKQRRGLHV